MVTETINLETTAVFNEDKTKRYELTKVFKPIKGGKSIVVIMLNAASSSIEETDTTVNYLLNKLKGEMNFSKITILNLIPDITNKLKPSKIDNLDDNFEYIEEVLKRKYDKILVGYGNSFIGNRVVDAAKYQLNEILKDYEDKLVEIGDEFDTFDCSPMHPLFASLRLKKWILKPYKLPKQGLKPLKNKENMFIKGGLIVSGNKEEVVENEVEGLEDREKEET